MYAIPPGLDGAADSRVAGLSCPECSGVLSVRLEGRRADLFFECRVGHTFTETEVLLGKEERLDGWLWAAYTALEEIVALTTDLAARESTPADTRRRYATRRESARATVERLRRVIDENEPIALPESGAPAVMPP
jgi:hypothetical protein